MNQMKGETPLRYLEKFPIGTQTPYLHKWADYIELLCLAHIDGRISKSDLIRRVKREKDFQDKT